MQRRQSDLRRRSATGDHRELRRHACDATPRSARPQPDAESGTAAPDADPLHGAARRSNGGTSSGQGAAAFSAASIRGMNLEFGDGDSGAINGKLGGRTFSVHPIAVH